MQTSNKKTKIIATIGPASESEDMMLQLLRAGVNIFRFNMKHNTLDWHNKHIRQAQHVAEEEQVPLGVMIDLQGPEIRINTHEDKDLVVQKDEVIYCYVKPEPQLEGQKCITIPHEVVIDALEVGDTFSLADGYQHFKVTFKQDGIIHAEAMDDYVIQSRKSLNLVQKDVALPSLVEADYEKLDLLLDLTVDFVALSFVRSKEDVELLQTELQKRNSQARIIAKIETQKGVDNVSEIAEAVYGVMIARGDLGIETPIETVTYVQKQIINHCRKHAKPVIVATQMLESMIYYPLPTRAEVADVANAVFDKTDCVMLSAETATGKYPLQTVTMMNKIITFNEGKTPYEEFLLPETHQTQHIAQAAVSIAQRGEVDKIIALTETGFTVRVLAGLRPTTPILGVSDREDTVGRLSLSFGTTPVLSKFPVGDIVSQKAIIDELLERGYVQTGETILLTHGSRYGEPGKTNALVLVQV